MSDSAKVSNSKPLDAAPPETDLRAMSDEDLIEIFTSAVVRVVERSPALDAQLEIEQRRMESIQDELERRLARPDALPEKDMTADIKTAILAHRKASMRLGSVRVANGRRGASDEAADEIDRAGEQMAKTERDLMALLARPDALRERVTISRDDLRKRIEMAWLWLHCGRCGRKHADDSPENVRLVVNEFMNAIDPDAAVAAVLEAQDAND